MEMDNITWIKRDLDDIKNGIYNIQKTLDSHEKRISRIEGANRVWIPTFLGLIGMIAGLFVGHVI